MALIALIFLGPSDLPPSLPRTSATCISALVVERVFNGAADCSAIDPVWEGRGPLFGAQDAHPQNQKQFSFVGVYLGNNKRRTEYFFRLYVTVPIAN